MQPIHCKVGHNPPESYGDCLRACVASLLELSADEVPHFYHDNPDPYEALRRVRAFLRPMGETIFAVEYPPVTRAELLDMMRGNNPDATCLLFGQTSGGGGHVVVCRGDQVIHNPAWHGCHVVDPGPAGWIVWVVARV